MLGASDSGKTSLIMRQTLQRIAQSLKEKEQFEQESRARFNVFEKGRQRNKLVYRLCRRADVSGDAFHRWHANNPEETDSAGASLAGCQVRMIVYDVNSLVSRRSQ